jgi:hypothetical protein
VSAPTILSGQDGEVVFVRMELPLDSATQARSRALSEGHNCAGMEVDAVDMLPIPAHFIETDAEWWVVKPDTAGATRYWRFRL